jgi:hypothetical protein
MGKTPPKQHPKPFRNAVRPYVEAILSMRRHKRMTWDEIARQLQAAPQTGDVWGVERSRRERGNEQ